MTNRFRLNRVWYSTDEETVIVLGGIVAAAKASGDGSAVQAMLSAGLATGRIVIEAVKCSGHSGEPVQPRGDRHCPVCLYGPFQRPYAATTKGAK
jgi:hypothetical protein